MNTEKMRALAREYAFLSDVPGADGLADALERCVYDAADEIDRLRIPSELIAKGEELLEELRRIRGDLDD